MAAPVTPLPPPAALAPKSWRDTAVEIPMMLIDKEIMRAVPEVGHLAPVILFFGSALLSVMSFNLPLGVFALSTLEAYGVFNLFEMFSRFITPPLSLHTPGAPTSLKQCKSGFEMMTPARFTSFVQSGLNTGFPNAPLFFLSFAASYCLQSMSIFVKEISDLGPSYSNRPYIGMIAAGMFILLYAAFLLAFGCTSFGGIAATVVVGLVTGFMICTQNNFLFGKEAVSMLFIPPLVERKGMDYVCVTTQSS